MNLLTVSDLGADGLKRVLDLGASVKSDPAWYRTALSGRSIGLFFMKQSLRTWVSCDIAAIQLGMHPIAIRNDQTGFGTRETPEDVGRVLDRYLDVLGMRVFDHGDLERTASPMKAPVINLLSDLEHPCQAVADLMTIAEHRPLRGATVAYVGDGNNVCRSLVAGVLASGGSMRVATPPGYEPEQVDGDLVIFHDPHEAVSGADVVYTDVWASMGQEDEAELRRRHFAGFQIDEDLFSGARDDAIFMHCLPAHRGEEVSETMLEHPRSRVFDQAENRLHSFKAILLHLLG